MSVKRYTASQIQKLGTYDEFYFVDATDYSSLLAVLRQCVEAMETHIKKATVGNCTCGAVAALAAAREYLEEAKP